VIETRRHGHTEFTFATVLRPGKTWRHPSPHVHGGCSCADYIAATHPGGGSAEVRAN
jgi:hypothetical protein